MKTDVKNLYKGKTSNRNQTQCNKTSVNRRFKVAVNRYDTVVFCNYTGFVSQLKGNKGNNLNHYNTRIIKNDAMTASLRI